MKNSKDFTYANNKLELQCVCCSVKLSKVITYSGFNNVHCICNTLYAFNIRNQTTALMFLSFHFDENINFPLRKNSIKTPNMYRLQLSSDRLFITCYKDHDHQKRYEIPIVDDFNIGLLMNVIKKYKKLSYFA